jgi:hypothetical protein
MLLKFSENFKNPVSQSLVWHIKHKQHFIMMLVVPLQIQAINPLIFGAQRLMSFLEVYMFF